MQVEAQQKHLKKIYCSTSTATETVANFSETKKLFQFLSQWKTFIPSCDEKHKNSMSL